jgi:ATP-dependent DNA helicase PIF1
MLINLDSEVGTGKSYLIDMISRHLTAIAEDRGHEDPVIRAVPTGVAAFNINGVTLHSLLKLPVKGYFEPLTGDHLAQLQVKFHDCHFLIIDEKSMIGLKMLYQIDQRLRQASLSHFDTVFGGKSVLLCGDFAQLLPVLDLLLFSTIHSETVEIIAAQSAYVAFKRTVVLDQVMRQQGEDLTALQFKEVLKQLRDGPISEPSWRLLLTRVAEDLPISERREFDNSLCLYGSRDMVATRKRLVVHL